MLPPSIIRVADELDQPIVQQASIGFDKNLTPTIGMRADYMWTRGYRTLRSVNINAPVDGVRPDPSLGNISELSSTGRRAQDRITVGFNMRVPSRRIFTNVMYQFASNRNYADSALSLPADSTDPDADWGPSAQDIRHRLFVMANFPLPFSDARRPQHAAGLGPAVQHHHRQRRQRRHGVQRSAGRACRATAPAARCSSPPTCGSPSRSTSAACSAAAPRACRWDRRPAAAGRRRGDAARPRRLVRGGGDGPQMVIMEGSNSRYRLDLYVSAQNLFNRTNLNNFVGNLSSQYFGTATSAMPARRLEIGATVSF